MTAVFNTKTLIPSRMTSTRQGHFASEIFTLNSNHKEDTTGLKIKALVDATPSSSGDIYRVNSSGWSRLLVWEILDTTGFRGATAKPVKAMVVLGKKDIYNTTGHPLDTSSMLLSNVDVPSSDYGWFPCTVLNSEVRPGSDANATPANTPPQGSHNVGNVFTFTTSRVGTVINYGVTSVGVSATNDTNVLGPAMIDVSGTKEVALLPIKNDDADTEGYLIGQFIS
tara:strand:- start:1571 stop:2245 length:675 start_codon:yes stop_codon:yes gene_type:complete